MFTNVAYLHNSLADMVDTSRSLVVTSCGYYRVHSRPVVSTERLNGRKVIFILTDHSDKKPLLLKEI